MSRPMDTSNSLARDIPGSDQLLSTPPEKDPAKVEAEISNKIKLFSFPSDQFPDRQEIAFSYKNELISIVDDASGKQSDQIIE
jgi:hypothetical protein